MSDIETTSRFFQSADGLKLHMRDYGHATDKPTIVCLPGLARTAEDFHQLANHLAHDRRVLALDYRGRGLSQYDPDWRNYNLGVENADLQAALAVAGVKDAIFVGTSRGGLHTMMLAADKPAMIRAAVLNDIGPVIEMTGLERIRAYVGKFPPITSWSQAIGLFKLVAGRQFPALTDEEWEAYARLTLKEENGLLVLRYDPQLMNTLQGQDFPNPLPDMWAQFEAMQHAPTLVIRGETSDLLSPQTVHEMGERHPNCQSFVVPGQGHAPLLLDMPTITRIQTFIEAI